MIFGTKVSPIALLGVDTTLADIAAKIQRKWDEASSTATAPSPTRQVGVVGTFPFPHRMDSHAWVLELCGCGGFCLDSLCGLAHTATN
jgi:hypothetical protein